MTVTGERADGTPANSNYTAKYDGQDVQVAGNAPYDTIAIKQVNANTLAERTQEDGYTVPCYSSLRDLKRRQDDDDNGQRDGK